ncbi:sensor histidine kinase [Nocardia carnea]|uniref:sensor histidine kinase n=1 Tax=Nocardia carnea TaxID=37328 RepID=UPI0024542410|nr:histidine kinase [Nocardia carnea]
MNTMRSALRTGPRYLISPWPWRALLAVIAGSVLSLLTMIGCVPVVFLGLTRSLRAALWEPMLRLHCARLRLVDPGAAARAAAEVREASAGRRMPTLRHVAFLGIVTVFGGAVYFLIALGFAVAAVLLAAPVLVRGDHIDFGPWSIDEPAQAWPAAAAGALATLVLLVLVGAWSAFEAKVARALLVSDPDRWRHEAVRIENSRSALLAAEGFERELLESELHDRVQHRLVALSMTLGLTESQDADGPAGRVAAEAHRLVDETLSELRAVLRGFSPRVLSERGLEPAVTDLAADLPLDIRIDLDPAPGDRLPPAVEHMSYVLVAECLTNVARHTTATRVDVRGSRAGSRWILTVSDDGPGGAHIVEGHGLDRLQRRLAALDGQLTVTSPPAGPTTIRMECAV